MARQDDYVRYTIRIPVELHASLRDVAGDASLNAEIIKRLESALAFDIPPHTLRWLEDDAEQTGRSLSEEITQRIELTRQWDLDVDNTPPMPIDQELVERITSIEREISFLRYDLHKALPQVPAKVVRPDDEGIPFDNPVRDAMRSRVNVTDVEPRKGKGK